MLKTPPTPQSPSVTVWYDADCPLCRREISLYRSLQPNESVCYLDANATDLVTPADVPRDALLARFHVQAANGELHSGASAFFLLWSVLPGWRWLARLGRLPGAVWLAERLYVQFLRVRPLMQRLFRRWDEREPRP